MNDILDQGGAFCILCGHVSETIIDGRKHDLAEHYDYVLAQCNGDKQLLKDWAGTILEQGR